MVNNFGIECLFPFQRNVPKRVRSEPAHTNPVRSLSLSVPRRRPADGRHSPHGTTSLPHDATVANGLAALSASAPRRCSNLGRAIECLLPARPVRHRRRSSLCLAASACCLASSQGDRAFNACASGRLGVPYKPPQALAELLPTSPSRL